MYIVFDCLTLEEFDSKTSTRCLSDRRSAWSFTSDNVQVLQQTRIQNEEHLFQLIEHAKSQKYEGLMLRKDVPYEGKRSKHLLKCKTFCDGEYTLIRIDTDKHRMLRDGKEVTIPVMAQAWIEHKGFPVAVGSGWSQEERIRYYARPHELIGKMITVQYFEETMNKSGGISLRFPTVKCVHGVERTT